MTGLLFPRISGGTTLLLVACVFLLAFAKPAHAFGAGNIASIARIEGRNFRHGDIEDAIKNLAFLGGAKWSAMNLRRVYFGNWLRDYSQALDVGTITKAQPSTIRVIVWVLAFMSFGYATAEFEVTEERLGVYRPEEHIDNPKDYADNTDARAYEPRLRPPVHPTELAIDPRTAMKNYIANEEGGWATSSGYVKHSLNRSIYYGRKYVAEGIEADLCEALRCLGQALHTMEDFSAHSNYVELALLEMGFQDVFPHTGAYTQVQVTDPNHYGRTVWPLVTGTFGAVDFYHSVLGEAQDKFTQSEIDEVNQTLGDAHTADRQGNECSTLRALLNQIPDTSALSNDAEKLERDAAAKEMENVHIDPSQYGSRAAAGSGGFDPEKTIRDIYPILEFRDKVMRKIEEIIEKIPGLMAIVERISESLTIFVMSLLAPYVQPLIARATLELQAGSSALIGTSAEHQWEVWSDPYSSDPTHSMLSKDHFSNILNSPAGQIAYSVVEYVVPRVLYAFEHPAVPVHEVLADVTAVFHHPALRDPRHELHTTMFNCVQTWVNNLPDRGSHLNAMLNSEAVKHGKNHTNGEVGGGAHGGHGKCSNGEWSKAEKVKKGGKKKKKEDTIEIGGMKIPTGALGALAGAGGGGKNQPGLQGLLGGVLQGFADQGSVDESGGKKKKEKKDKYDDEYASHGEEKKKKKKDKYDDESNPGDYKDEKKKKKKDKGHEDEYASYGEEKKKKKKDKHHEDEYASYGEEKKKKKKDKYASEEEDDGKKKKKEYKYDEYGNKIKVDDKDKKKKKKKKDDGDSGDEGHGYPGAYPGTYPSGGGYESHGHHHGHHGHYEGGYGGGAGADYYGGGYGGGRY